MIKNNSYNFAEIQHRIDAARSLQDAGQDEKCTDILKELAGEILK